MIEKEITHSIGLTVISTNYTFLSSSLTNHEYRGGKEYYRLGTLDH